MIVLILIIAMATPLAINAATKDNIEIRVEPGEFDPSKWDQILQSFVTFEGVDWNAWAKHGPQEVAGFLDHAAEYSLKGILGKEPRVAFLMNVYNAHAVHQILKAYPIDAVTEIEGFFDGNTVLVDGQERTLNQIHDRICEIGKHFPQCSLALSSGARSHAPLSPRAFTSSNLLAQSLNAGRALVTENLVLDGPNRIITIPGCMEPRMAYYHAQHQGLPGSFHSMVLASALVVLSAPQEILFAPMDFSLRRKPVKDTQ